MPLFFIQISGHPLVPVIIFYVALPIMVLPRNNHEHLYMVQQLPHVCQSGLIHCSQSKGSLLYTGSVRNTNIQATSTKGEHQIHHFLPLDTALKWSPIKEHSCHSLLKPQKLLINDVVKLSLSFSFGTITQSPRSTCIRGISDKFSYVTFFSQ